MYLCRKCRERLSYREESTSEQEGVCEQCGNLLEHIDDYFEMFKEETKGYQFSTFLIGLRVSKDRLQRDIEYIAKMSGKIRNYKDEFQFQLGKKIETELHYTVDFERPELTFIINQDNMDYSLWVRPVFVTGRYLKKRRGIPQSPWIKPGKGKESEKSVSEYVGQPVCNAFEGRNYDFFASGREDVDALMLGKGRPFYVEVKAPRRRSTDFQSLSKRVTAESKEGVEVIDLTTAGPSEIEELKGLKSDKTYEVGLTVEGENTANIEDRLKGYSSLKIGQKTPSRVLNIRKDKLRERTIRSIEVKKFDGNQLVLLIKAEAGTYIKEFITGDHGRTVPNLKDELDINVKIDYLNVLEVK
jgi:tRNA pseudouridine synthase 10